MNRQSGAWLEDVTAEEARALFDDGMPVILPLAMGTGGSAPQLALKAETMAVRALAQRLIDRLPIVAAPVLDLAAYSAGASAALSAAIGTPLMLDLVGRLRAAGARRFVLLADGEAASSLEALKAEDLLVVEMGRLGAAPERLPEVPVQGCIGEPQTSILLALDPRSVRMARLGDAAGASAFKGERILDARVRDARAIIVKRWPDLAVPRPRG